MSSAPQKQAVEEPVMQTQETPRAPPPQAWGRGLPIQQEMAARAQAAAVNQDQIQQPVVAPTVPVSTPNTKGLEKATAKLSVSNDEGGFQSNAVNENKGPKSWADIARPEGGDVEVAGPEIGGPTGTGNANTSNINDPETGASAGRTGLNDSQQQRGGGSGTRRGGRGGQGNNGSNVASNRGRLNANQMQGQAQKLAAAQQIAVQAVQYGIDPVVYQAQLASMYGFPPDVPLGFGQFGPSPNPQQDDRAYPFLEFFRMYPHLTLVNQTTAIDPRITAEAHYFVVRVSCEQEMHRMLKYSVWTGKDSLSIQQLHGCFVNSAGPHGPNGPPSRRVFLFFYVTSVNRVAGLAEMMSPLMPSRHVPGDVEFLLQWVFAKDVPEGDFPREANLATKAAASSKGAEKKQQQTTTTSEQSVSDNQTGPQEVVMSLPSQIGQHCIHVVIEKPLSTSVLMNFKFFDQAELYGQNVVDSQSSGNQKGRGGVGGQGGRGRGANRNGHNNSNANSGANSGKSIRGGVARSGSRGGAARGGDSDGRRAQRGGQSGGRGQGRGGSRGRGGGALGERSGRSGRSDGGGAQDFGRRQVEGIDGRAQLGGAFQFEIQHKVKQDKKKKKKKGSDEEQADTPANEGDAAAAAAATEQQ